MIGGHIFLADGLQQIGGGAAEEVEEDNDQPGAGGSRGGHDTGCAGDDGRPQPDEAHEQRREERIVYRALFSDALQIQNMQRYCIRVS